MELIELSFPYPAESCTAWSGRCKIRSLITRTVLSARRIELSSPVLAERRRVWPAGGWGVMVGAGLHRPKGLPQRVVAGHLCKMRSAVWFCRPQGHRGEGKTRTSRAEPNDAATCDRRVTKLDNVLTTRPRSSSSKTTTKTTKTDEQTRFLKLT